MKIIGLCGQAGSGKSQAGKYIEEKYGIKLYDLSSIIKEEAEKRDLPTDKNSLASLADVLREEYNDAFVSQKMLDKIKGDKSEIAIVAGFRSPEEVDYMRNEVDDFFLILVHTDPRIRYERRIEKSLSEEEFFSRDEDDIRVKHLRKTLSLADIRIDNNDSLDELYKKLDSVLKIIKPA